MDEPVDEEGERERGGKEGEEQDQCHDSPISALDLHAALPVKSLIQPASQSNVLNVQVLEPKNADTQGRAPSIRVPNFYFLL